MLQEQKTKYLTTAVEAVALASRVTRAVQRQIAEIGSITKDDRSPVTVADFAAQAIVAHHLATDLRLSPEVIKIVGEESAGVLRQDDMAAVRAAVVEAVGEVWPGATEEEVLTAIDSCNHDGSARAYWTLDPVDGTKGFLRNQQYAISLAWIESGRVDLGVMGCPNISEDETRPFDDPDPQGTIFFATRGDGAWMLPADRADETDLTDPSKFSRPIRRKIRPDDALIRTCESVESAHTKHDDAAKIVESLGGGGEPARLDSQAKYGIVARGQADAYLRLPTRPGYVEKIWDHAAGALVATEAGATVSDITGAPLDFSHGPRLERNRGIICASQEFHSRIIEAINELGIAQSVET